jgi:hypothetical protein
VPILVVVVITEMRSFRTEVEKGSRRRAIRSGLVDPKRFVKYDKKCEEFSSKKQTFLIESKGKNVKIHFTWLGQGNGLGAKERGGSGQGRGSLKNFFFLLSPLLFSPSRLAFFWDINCGDAKELEDGRERRECGSLPHLMRE